MKVSLCLLFLLSLVVPLGAEQSAFAQNDLPESYQDDTDRYVWRQKLRRGVTNAVTGWLELPFTIFSEVVFGSRSPFEGLAIGVVKGTGKTLERTGVGLFETATFYIPSYEPILKPEYAQISFSSSTEDFGDPREGLHVRTPTGLE
jgi:putative exosortase-associated protein (TIGR04073 family)